MKEFYNTNCVKQNFTMKVENNNLLCPVCDFHHLHVTGVHAQPVGLARQLVTLTPDGVSLETNARPGGYGRGNDVIITFQCECHHEFAYRFAFHKGETEVELKTRHLEKGEEIQATLWRD